MKKNIVLLLSLLSLGAVAQIKEGRLPSLHEDSRLMERFKEKRSGALLNHPQLQIQQNVAYGSHPREKMDVYTSKMPQTYKGIVVFVHGGGWSNGDKDMPTTVEPKALHYTSQGLLFISLAYPLLPEDPVSRQEQAIQNATNFIAKSSLALWATPPKIILMGHSAGAHLVALVGAKAQTSVSPKLIVSLDAGAIDVPKQMQQTGHLALWADAFTQHPQTHIDLSPHHQLHAQSTPTLIVCARASACAQGAAFVKKAATFGVSANVLEAQGKSHKTVQSDIGVDRTYTQRMDAFIQKALKE